MIRSTIRILKNKKLKQHCSRFNLITRSINQIRPWISVSVEPNVSVLLTSGIGNINSSRAVHEFPFKASRSTKGSGPFPFYPCVENFAFWWYLNLEIEQVDSKSCRERCSITCKSPLPF
jgi:hypothetical protein